MEAISNRGSLYIGTSGWSYQHWAGIFYPGNIPPAQFLEYYFTKFDCVELNASFYQLPFKATVSGWMRRTPERFRFCTKLSRFITHQKHLANCEEALKNYFDRIEGLNPKLGPILIQLPPGFPYDKERFVDFMETLQQQQYGYRFAVEIRDESWIRDEFFDLLSRYSVAFVIPDAGGKFPYAEAVTTDFIYLRFHGRKQLYATDYTTNDLTCFSEKIQEWLNEGKDVWAFFNNDFGGYSPKNALELKEIMSARICEN